MTDERKKQLHQIADSLELCGDHEKTCKGCVLVDVMKESTEDAEHCGAILTRRAALAIRELLNEVNYLSTVNGHLKEMAGKVTDCEEEGISKGQAWQLGLYERAISRWGDKAQVLKAIEELGELAVELSRWLNSYDPADGHLLSHIREELADVCIMCDQLQLIFGDVSVWEMHKLERLERRLDHGL